MEIARVIVGGELRPYGEADVVDGDAEWPLNDPGSAPTAAAREPPPEGRARGGAGGQLRPYGEADVVDGDAEFPLNHPEHDRIVEGGARQARADRRGEVDDGARIGLAVAGQDASQAMERGGDGQPETFRIRCGALHPPALALQGRA